MIEYISFEATRIIEAKSTRLRARRIDRLEIFKFHIPKLCLRVWEFFLKKGRTLTALSAELHYINRKRFFGLDELRLLQFVFSRHKWISVFLTQGALIINIF